MNKAMLTVGIIILSLATLLMINIISNYSSGSELDYYLVKETSEAAMVDAIDVKYYRENGLLRIDKEKFVESFVRRFADSVDTTRNYQLSFYDLNEVPPKVSVKVDSSTVLSFKGSNLEMSTQLDAILENTYKTDPLVTNELSDPNSDLGKGIEEK
ncbi:MAG: DUF5411 family protein [Candidatus Faecimonas sp.]|nr:DUF5411 family protein [Mycoplasmatota bacterium]MDY2907536.1 DUF5411 family protein [Candidatus Faecimonas sp.]